MSRKQGVPMSTPWHSPARRNIRIRSIGGSALLHLFLIAVALTCLVPFAWMVGTSFKTFDQVLTYPPRIVPDPAVLDSWRAMFNGVTIWRYLFNSVFVTGVIVLSQCIFNTMAAYVFARIEFRGRDLIFLLYLGSMMVPAQVTLIPQYVLVSKLGWIDSYFALTIPFVFGSAFGTFLLRQFFLSLPRDLDDAAKLDGAGHLRILWDVAIPQAKPAIATFAVFCFLFFWNDFLWPLIVTNTNGHKTLQVGLATLSRSYFGTNWPMMMAVTTFAVIPILVIFIFAQRYFVQGITLTGLKG